MAATRELPVLERTLAPREDGEFWRRDLAVIAPLVLLAAVLLPGWGSREFTLRMVLSPALLMSLAFLLALRRGAVDLSVWMVADLSAVVTGLLILRGLSSAAAVAAGLAAGIGVGAVNGLLVARLKVPAPAATLAVAVTLMLALRARVQAVDLSPADASGPLSPYEASAVLAGMVYIVALATVTALSIGGIGRRVSGRWSLVAALCTSGLVAAAAGVCRLIDRSGVTVSALPIGQLRVPAAAVLAGGVFLSAQRRTALSVLCLPPALILATAWMLETSAWWYHGYYVHLVGLMVLVVGVHVLLKAALEGSNRSGWIWAAAVLAALFLSALTGRADTPSMRTWLTVAGWGAFSAGVVGAGVTRILSPRGSR